MKPLFITLEGIEGVGKSTHISMMCDFLHTNHIPVIKTREPGGTAVGEKLRDFLLNDSMCSDTELLLMFAARAELVNSIILPALQQNHWVICDRFTDSSYAYQGGGRGIDKQRIALLETWVQGDLRPDTVILFDAPVEIALERTKNRNQSDKFEREKQDFFNKVRAVYLQRAAENPNQYHIIDATLPLNTVSENVKIFLNTLI